MGALLRFEPVLAATFGIGIVATVSNHLLELIQFNTDDANRVRK